MRDRVSLDIFASDLGFRMVSGSANLVNWLVGWVWGVYRPRTQLTLRAAWGFEDLNARPAETTAWPVT